MSLKVDALRAKYVAERLEAIATLEVYTKCPSKYKLIDMETGEEYIGQLPQLNNPHWKKI